MAPGCRRNAPAVGRIGRHWYRSFPRTGRSWQRKPELTCGYVDFAKLDFIQSGSVTERVGQALEERARNLYKVVVFVGHGEMCMPPQMRTHQSQRIGKG